MRQCFLQCMMQRAALCKNDTLELYRSTHSIFGGIYVRTYVESEIIFSTCMHELQCTCTCMLFSQHVAIQ